METSVNGFIRSYAARAMERLGKNCYLSPSMTASRIKIRSASAAPSAAQKAREIASGEDWSIRLVDCDAGPEDAPFEERHSGYSIASVVSGAFQYRTDSGSALLYPGAFLLGNAGACFVCGHDHSQGDRCVAFRFSPQLFEEIAASNGGSHRFRFARAALPARSDLAPAIAELAALREGDRKFAGSDVAIRLAEKIIAAAAGAPSKPQRVSAHDERRISRALRHIERAADEPIDLDRLAGIAAMSKYHFLRTFRRVTGLTPYQHVLGLRLRNAALALRKTAEPVAGIAYAAGFSDLSTFNRSFRSVFGRTPTQYRSG